MGKNTSLSLGEYYERFIENLISLGRYKDASEVVQAGLRILEEDENMLSALKISLKNGDDSWFATGDAEKYLKSLKASKGLNS